MSRDPRDAPDARRPLRPPFAGGPSRRPAAGEPDRLTRTLRDELGAEYAGPGEPGYWDLFEARVLAAVREAATTTTGAFRAVPAAAVDWWHALARWAEPGLVAAAITIVVALAVFVNARATVAAERARSAFHDVLDAPAVGLAKGPAGEGPAGEGPADGSAERRDATFRELLPPRR